MDKILKVIFDAAYLAMLGECGDGTILIIIRRLEDWDYIIKEFDKWLKFNKDLDKFCCLEKHSIANYVSYYDNQESIVFTNLKRQNFNGQEYMYEYIFEI